METLMVINDNSRDSWGYRAVNEIAEWNESRSKESGKVAMTLNVGRIWGS
jgi:hypothetical protein